MAGMEPDTYDILSDGEADEQHKKLFVTYEQLMLSDKGLSREDLTRMLDDLDAFTKTHFVTEEQLFEAYSYPEAPAHIAEHRQFSHNLLGLRLRLTTEAALDEALRRTSTSIFHWLVKHVGSTDVAAGDFIRSRRAELAGHERP